MAILIPNHDRGHNKSRVVSGMVTRQTIRFSVGAVQAMGVGAGDFIQVDYDSPVLRVTRAAKEDPGAVMVRKVKGYHHMPYCATFPGIVDMISEAVADKRLHGCATVNGIAFSLPQDAAE